MTKAIPKADNSDSKAALALFACLLVAFVLGLYWPTFQYPFVNYDDPGYISTQPRVLQGMSWENVRWAFTTFEFANWHPLTWLSYMADISLFGVNPGRMHTVNVALHLVNALLFLWLLSSLTGQIAESGFAALWFALHPLRVESVAWISERKDMLSTLFGLLAIIGYVAYARSKSKRAYLLALLLFLCSLMSKPMLVTLPALLLLLDWWPLKRLQGEPHAKWRSLLMEKLPFLALSIAIAALAYHAQFIAGSVFGLEKYSLATRFQNALASFAIYIAKTLFPVNLAVFYPYPVQPPLLPTLLGAVVVLVMLWSVALLWRRDSRCPAIHTGLFWFAGTLLPVIGIIQVGQQAHADRYTYIPGMGLCIALAWGTAELMRCWEPQRRSLIWVAIGWLTLAPLIFLTHRQVSYWQDSERLWTHTLEITENNYVAHGSLGQFLQVLDRNDEALWHLKEAARIKPDHPQTYSNLGLIYEGAGKHQDAEEAYKQSSRLAPYHPIPHLNLGSLYLRTGRAREAEAEYKQVLALDPMSSDGLYNLGLIYSRDGRSLQAVEAYQRAVSISPNAADIRRNLALLLTQLDRQGEAVEQYQQWLRLEPRSAIAHNNLANALVRLGRAAEAVAHYQQASALDAKYIEPLLNLGTVQLNLGDRDAAEKAWKAALRVDPNNSFAARRLQELTSNFPSAR